MSDQTYTTQFSQEEINNEEWRIIPIFDGIYSVSNLGRVRRNTNGRGTWKGKIMIPIKKQKGYYGVCLRYKSKNRDILIHALVALAFIGERPKGYDINHKDGIKGNNRPDNLEYISHADNMHHGAKLGLFANNRGAPKRMSKKHTISYSTLLLSDKS